MIKDGRYAGVCKVGEKGQIVIPKTVRDMFNINPGENLIVFADCEKGIALVKDNALDDVMKSIFKGEKK